MKGTALHDTECDILFIYGMIKKKQSYNLNWFTDNLNPHYLLQTITKLTKCFCGTGSTKCFVVQGRQNSECYYQYSESCCFFVVFFPRWLSIACLLLITTHPCARMLRLKQPSLSHPRESAPHWDTPTNRRQHTHFMARHIYWYTHPKNAHTITSWTVDTPTQHIYICNDAAIPCFFPLGNSAILSVHSSELLLWRPLTCSTMQVGL